MFSVLLPTDFSENSMNAIRYALEFFKYQRTEFYIMHAYRNEFYDSDELSSSGNADAVFEELKNHSDIELKNLLEKIEEWAPHDRFTYQTISVNDTLVAAANAIVDDKNVDLIVMGTKGKSDNRNIIFGSETFQVLKFVKCPVLAIPSNYTNTQPKRILFPTDYLTPYKRRELKLLSVLAKSYRSDIHVLFVSTLKSLSKRQRENQDFLKDALDDNDLIIKQEMDRNISTNITDYIQNKEMDMLAMVNTQHSFLEDVLFPSTIDKVSLGLTIPLLALQNSERP